MATQSRSVLWVDAAAGATITRINSSGGAGGITSALLTLSNADKQQWWESDLHVNSAPTPVAAEYQSVTQRASLIFTTTAPGVMITLKLVAPKLSIFLSDGVTVDLSNANVIALAAACAGVLSNVQGDTAVSLIAGILD